MRSSTMIPAALAVLLAAPAAGQQLATRVAAAPDGEVRLHYASREGVCAWDGTAPAAPRERAACPGAPVRVSLDVRGGQLVGVRTRVGSRWAAARGPVTELGGVDAREAVEQLLLPLAERSASGQVGSRAIFTASMAQGVRLDTAMVRIARSSLPAGTRRTARYWLAQEAANATARPPAGRGAAGWELEHDQEVQKLVRLRSRGDIPELVRIARGDPDPLVRSSALFWLATSTDPRAVDLFEDLLRR